MHTVRPDIFHKEKARDHLIIQRQLGAALRECLNTIVAEPVPETLTRLIQALDVETRRPDAQSGALCRAPQKDR
ncbi:hypothetical protein [Methylocystis echinoides]|uniref:hypothetical protein n=1 Tax=Methylocystis echinoides TaxID=29468 RepID=UPI003439E183